MNTLTVGSGSERPSSVTLDTLSPIVRLLVTQFADPKITVSLSPIVDRKGTTPGQRLIFEMQIPQTLILNKRTRRKVSSLMKVYVFIFIPVEG
jgi:predicted PP-loop superfamily ATPase